MALSIQLPLQASEYISTLNAFEAPFNAPEVGKYSFNVDANVNQVVLPVEINSYYLIERMFISGNITSEDYLASMDFTDVDALPAIVIRRLKDKVNSHVKKIPAQQFTLNRESPIFIKSDKKGDAIIMSFTGIVGQIAATVGVDPLIITVGLSIYQINEKFYNIGMRTALDSDFGLSKKRTS